MTSESVPAARYLILYCGDSHTYVCDDGDCQPTYPDLPPLREETVQALLKHHGDGPQPCTTSSGLPAPLLHSSPALTTSGAAKGLATSLCQVVSGRELVLVASTASSTYWPTLLQCLFLVGGAASVYVISDVVATTLACGQVEESAPSVLVVQASWSDMTVSMVTDGYSRRYTTSSDGSLRDIIASTSTADSLRSLAAPSSSSEPLRQAAYRAQLIHAFGFRNYVRVLQAYELREQREIMQKRAAAAGSSKGKGKGKGRGVRQAEVGLSRGPDGSRGEWVAAYTHAEKSEPGVVEKRLVRVLKTPPAANTLYPVMITGEALQVPFYADLLRCAVLHCGPSVLRVVAREHRVKEREREARKAALQKQQEEDEQKKKAKVVSPVAADMTKSGQKASSRGRKPTASRKRSRRSDEDEDEDEDEEDESDDTDSGSTSDDDDDDDDEEEEEEEEEEKDESSSGGTSESSESEVDDAFDPTAEEGEWLVVQREPIEPTPPWLPLVGGAVLARVLPTFDSIKMRISLDEVESSKGQVVFWKAVL